MMEEHTPWNGTSLSEQWIRIYSPQRSKGDPGLIVSQGKEHFRVPLNQVGRFIGLHADRWFAGDCATTTLAELLHAAECDADLVATQAIWRVLAENRVLDLSIAREVLRLAAVLPTKIAEVFTANEVEPFDAVVRLLDTTAEAFSTSDTLIRPYGPLGIGLQVGVSVALKLTSLRGLLLKPTQANLAAKVNKQSRKLYEATRRSPGPTFLPANFGDGTHPPIPSGVKVRFDNWRGDFEHSMVDARGLHLFLFLEGAGVFNAAIEHWPGWAFQSPETLKWCNLLQSCKLDRELRKSCGGVVHPQFEVLPRFRKTRFELGDWAEEVYAALDTGYHGRAIKLTFPGLTLRAFTKQLGSQLEAAKTAFSELASRVSAPESGDAKSEEAVALLMAAGLDQASIRRQAEHVFRQTISKSMMKAYWGKWSGLLADHLRDPSVDQWCLYWQSRGISLTPAEIFAVAPGLPSAESVARAFHGGSQRFGTGKREQDIPSKLRNQVVAKLGELKKYTEGPFRNDTRHQGRTAGEYRSMTDERVVLPSGLAKSDLLWIAARWAQVFDTADEIVKALIFQLSTCGLRILGWQRETLWIDTKGCSPQEVCVAADSLLQSIPGQDNGKCQVFEIT